MDTESPPPATESSAKTSILCSNMPESLFDSTVAKKHFGRFGRVKTILLRPKKHMCVVDYDTAVAAQRALLNAGAYDGFMFDVTWNKKKKSVHKKEPLSVKKRAKDDDPDWLPDSEVEGELTAMSTVPVYRQSRQQPMQQNQPAAQAAVRKLHAGRTAIAKLTPRDRPSPTSTASAGEPATVVSVPTTMNTAEAAAELQQLRTRVSRTADEQRRTLDARDRILRAWGGTGSRLRLGGCTIGTCPDMCPEKERLQRQVEHQVQPLECEENSETMAEWRAVKQYSRSSADQEMPMCYELRPPSVLTMTMAYLLCEIADCAEQSQVSLADWFHFMWDRCRSIRKDITQQALCCADSVRLVEQCARFHAHCAARLADLDHTQFDQRLNTDNLTKCLQTLKHMYADLPARSRPREAEFRSYVALLNLGDANFCWEIKQLPEEIQKSEAITFAIQIFIALDNNNYVRFFRLIREKATYLQACILLRYFNDVRARGLARIVKALSPRGISKYPVRQLLDNLAFEDAAHLQAFLTHYGFRFSQHDDDEPQVILDRSQFIEDSDPYPISRAAKLIESKRSCSVGEIISGGPLPDKAVYSDHIIYSSFNDNGTLKLAALIGEDLGYDTINESNKNLSALKKELDRMTQTQPGNTSRPVDPRGSLPARPESKVSFIAKQPTLKWNVFKNEEKVQTNAPIVFSFKPAIPVVSPEVVKSSPEKLFAPDTKTVFAFSKPEENKTTGLWTYSKPKNIFASNQPTSEGIFATSDTSKNVFRALPHQMQDESLPFIEPESTESYLFSEAKAVNTQTKAPNLFAGTLNQPLFKSETPASCEVTSQGTNLFLKPPEKAGITKPGNVFAKSGDNLFVKPNATSIFSKPSSNIAPKENTRNIFAAVPGEQATETSRNIFAQAPAAQNIFTQKPTNVFNPPSDQNIFGQNNDTSKPARNLFLQSDETSKPDPKSLFAGTSNIFNQQNQQESSVAKVDPPPSPKSVFKSAFPQNNDTVKASFGSSLFSENKVLDVAFGSLTQQPTISQSTSPEEEQLRQQKMEEELRKQQEFEETRRLEEARRIEDQRVQELRKQEEMRKDELRRQEEHRRREVEKQRQEELRRRLEEEQKQAELKRLEEEKRKEEEAKRKAEERRLLLTEINRQSEELVDELTNDVVSETAEELLKIEIEEMRNLVNFAKTATLEFLQDVVNDICEAEMKAEKYLTEKLMEKFGAIWISNTARNIRRRKIIQETPIWLAGKSPLQAANLLRRKVLPVALAQMEAFHKGHVFTGETKPQPKLSPYNIMEVVRTSLMKGLKKARIQYHKCLFWKITLSSPGSGRWLNKQINVQDWLMNMFSDKDFPTTDSDNIVYLKKHSWNSYMHSAISVSMMEPESEAEVLEGSSGIIFYSDENDQNLLFRLNKQLQGKSSKHILPVAVITSKSNTTDLEKLLKRLASRKTISTFKILKINGDNNFTSMDKCTKTALKWLAKNLPDVPTLELDSLKSILLRCIGTELWYRLSLERETRMSSIYTDMNKLIQLYNNALEKLSSIIANDNLHIYPSFPPELKQFLENNSSFPKSYEFFPSDWASAENVKVTRNIMKSLTLPQPNFLFFAVDPVDLQKQIHNFCNQIEWFENPFEVSCKIISHLPRELTDLEMNSNEFSLYFEQYDFLDFVNIVVLEKINNTRAINDKYVIYDLSALDTFRNTHWWYEIELVAVIKHKAVEFVNDELDDALNESFTQVAKRMKFDESDQLLELEENDESLVDKSISEWNSEISRLDSCNSTMRELEVRLEEEVVKASNLEEILRSALYDEC